MKFTTSVGWGEHGKGPACHLLEICQARLLLECPLDLSALSLFLPTFLPTHRGSPAPSPCLKSSVKNAGIISHLSGHRRKEELVGDGERGPSSSTKRQCVTKLAQGSEKSGGKSGVLSPPFRELGGHVLIDGEPWYRTAELGLVDVALLDAVIISNPTGMLGLPFLTRNPDFSAKIYVTEATAKIGQLMMEELVAMHAEFVQIYGRPRAVPSWLDLSVLTTLPEAVRNRLVGKSGAGRANWHPLYSKADIRHCMTKVHCLRYGEQVNMDGCLQIRPSSSGLGIGASNWSILGARRNVAYVAASLSTPNHAMALDISALKGCQTLLFCDVEASDESSATTEVKVGMEGREIEAKAGEILRGEGGAQGSENPVPARQSSTGSAGSQRLTTATSGGSSSNPLRAGPSSGSVVVAQKPPSVSGAPSVMSSEKGGKGSSSEGGGAMRPDTASPDVRTEVASLCKAAVETTKRGGSVLIPVSPFGVLLELLEEMAVHLGSANLAHIPMLYISPGAEEMLAYGNTVPEWLCLSRQDKLYAGEPLFGYVDLIREERLCYFPALYSPDLLSTWQEPCIVFAAHSSLRIGPAVQLLNRWSHNSLCLLILTESNLDRQLSLAPFQPLAIQVLELPVHSRLSPKEAASIIQELESRVTLVPEFLLSRLEATHDTNTDIKSRLTYRMGQVLRVPNFENELEVDMSAELALQVQPKPVKPSKVAAAFLHADLCIKDGLWSLEVPSPVKFPGDPLLGLHSYHWGQVNVDALLTALKDRGLFDVYLREPASRDSSVEIDDCVAEKVQTEVKSTVVEILNPSHAWIEVRPNGSHIKAEEPSLRRLVAEAVKSVLHGL